MNIIVRNERISDYSPIANVNYEAFLAWHPDNQYVSEPLMVGLLRHNSLYDPELSLVAELEGKIIGHALFSPFRFVVLGREEKGVVLGPIAVDPKFQRAGVGKFLIQEGHRKALEKGFSFSLLCGHTDYYPKFGYKTKMFSLSGSKVSINRDRFNHEDFRERPVNEQDIPWMVGAWQKMHGKDNLALFPGFHISEWSNHGFQCRCTVVLKGGQILGYARYVKSDPLSIKDLVVLDGGMPDMLAYLAWKHYGKPQGDIHLSLSDETVNRGISGSESFKAENKQAAHGAFMIKVLDEQNSSISEYCRQVENGDMKPGIIVFPPMFDVDDGRVD